MTRHCAVKGCSADKRYCKFRPKPKFHKFPGKIKRLEARLQWLKNVNRMNPDGTPWEPKPESVVCNRHFVEGKPTDTYPVPQVAMGHNFVTEVVCRRPLKRNALLDKSTQDKRSRHNTSKENKENVPGNINTAASRDGSTHKSKIQATSTIPQGHPTPYCETEDYVCTDIGYQRKVLESMHTYSKSPSLDPRTMELEEELRRTNAQLRAAKNELEYREKPFSYRAIEGDDEKTRQFTGFPSYQCFNVIFEKLIKPKARRLATNHKLGKGNWYKGRFKSKPGPSRKLEIKDEFFLVMMRLRMGLMHYDLAVRFRVSTSQVSIMISRWLPFLARCLKKLVQPPSREMIQKHMPASFRKKHPNTRVIIDCTEIFMERPTNLLARQQTWSSYKHHNTAKLLIGCTPEGGISHVSKAWGGRTSDKHIVLHSGFMDTLEPYDEVMADRGFTIAGDLAEISCTLNLPPFTLGKSQLSKGEVERHRTVSSLRIHIERVIERLKNFVLLQGIYRISQYRLLTDIVTVCSAVINLWEPIVKK